MEIMFNGKERELKYTFNSFKYMDELDLSAVGDIENKPFAVIPMIVLLLLGALNHDKGFKVKESSVEDFLEEYIVENDIAELMENLIELLQNSAFFKSLQKKKTQKAKKK